MKNVAILGIGTMGPGIAATLARGGMTVRATDTSREALEMAGGLIEGAFAVLDALDMPAKGNASAIRLHDTLEDCVAGAELVIETIPENLELKLDLLTKLDGLVSPDCLLASDTSGIPITKLQDGNSHPGRVVGMHWSNPPHIIPIIEVVAGAETAPETVERMSALIRDINLIPILIKKDVPGFVENRVLYAIMRECVDLVEDGVIDAEALDQCVSWGIGYKLSVVGPMALLDMAGLDIYQAVGSYLNKELSTRADVSPMITEKTAKGEFGIKSGSGMFDYTPEEISKLRQARAQKLIAARKALENN